MLFKKEHEEMILNGTKTATRRIWKKPRVKINGIYKAKLKMLSTDYFAKIRVLRLYKQQLGDMTVGDPQKEGYPTLQAFRNIWIKINGSWDDALVVDVIEFEKVIENLETKL